MFKIMLCSILLSFAFISPYSAYSLEISLPATALSCGEHQIQVTANCAFSGQLSVQTLDASSGVIILSISPVVLGNCQLLVAIEPGAQLEPVLLFEVTESDDPSGCALVGQQDEASLQTTCACGLVVSMLVQDESCFSCGNGQVSAVVEMDFNASYSWNTGETSSTITGLQPGNYQVTISDGSLCEVQASAVVNPYMCPGFSAVYTEVDNLCFDQTNGMIVIEGLSNQSNDYTLLWENGSEQNERNNLSAGDYFLTITNEDNCVEMFEFTLTDPPAIEWQLTTIQHTNNLGSPGSILVSGMGGTGQLTYTLGLGNVVVSQNESGWFDSLTKACYHLEIMDSLGCALSQDSLCIALDCLPFEIFSHKIDESCGGSEDGVIQIDSTGAYGIPLQYSWNTGQQSSSIDSLIPGIYEVTITDTYGCLVKAAWNIEGVEALLVTADSVVHSSGMHDGEIFCSASGGHGGNTFMLFSDSLTRSDTTGRFSALPPGCYDIQVMDAQGCISESITACIDIETFTNDTEENSIRIFPNPVSSQLLISSDDFGDFELYIYSLSGKLMGNYRGVNTIDVRDLNPGSYVVRIISKSFQKTIPFIKILP